MKSTCLIPILTAGNIFCAFLTPVHAANTLNIPNPGFEEQLSNWDNQADNGLSKASAEAAHSGKFGLRVTDESEETSSSLFSQKIPVTPGTTYQVQFWTRLLLGKGVGVYLRFFGADGKVVTATDEDKITERAPVVDVEKEQAEWTPLSGKKTAPANATSVMILIHSYAKAKVMADFDDFELSEVGK